MCYGHGQMYRVARQVLSTETWTKKYEFRNQLITGVTPAYFARRHAKEEEKQGKKLNLNATINRLIAHFVRSLRGRKFIEQRWPTGKKGSKDVYEIRLTALGGQQKQKKAKAGNRIKMSMELARELRAEYRAGTRQGPGSLAWLSKKYSVSDVQIYRIARNQCWKEKAPPGEPSGAEIGPKPSLSQSSDQTPLASSG